ncbi:glycoside hydrolase family 104 protein [Halomonas eurihalina]|uniref:Glycoside hydrolase family 104 protein n=1 Tax=Halomonas eurihalina TaxID=42566 RepID=A0A5D9DBP5_HALER|nr:glycoside hydrolase family 104 protein [Halomonas eurihalina]MDR5859421.1 glycoside hydrolase family 104 protein [Halomonas eurihalina]TZG40540.1 glycoside hydrolase family 104 protein [Halomonas eurihalina]
MPRISPAAAGGANVCAFLDVLAHAEIGPAMLAASDDGYDILVGSMPGDIHLFAEYVDHPLPTDDLSIEYAPGVHSTAAGRYQILNTYWPHYKRQLGLSDFRPESQDRYAIQQIREQRALPLIQSGRFSRAVEACSNIWASLPGAGYGQREHKIEDLVKVYVDAGGQLAGRDRDWYDRVVKKGGA